MRRLTIPPRKTKQLPRSSDHFGPKTGQWLVIALSLLSACTERMTPANDLETWSVDAVPTVSVSGNDDAGNPLISSVKGVVRLENGQVVVADNALLALRWFDAEGQLLRSVGVGDGGRKDKFVFITGLLRCGDSLYVKDFVGNPPMRVYSLDGTLARSFAFDSPYMPDGCNAERQFVRMGPGHRSETTGSRKRKKSAYAVYDAQGELRATLGDHPATEYPGSQTDGSHPLPLGRETLLAIGRERVYVGTADSFSVLVFGTNGDPVGALRYDDVDLRTTAADIDRFKYLDTVGLKNVTLKVMNWETLEFPPNIPAYDAMLVDASDMLWLRRTPRGIGGDAEWIVFSSDGAPTARLVLPGDFRVTEIGYEYVAGVLAELGSGKQAVQVYTLRR